MTRDHKRRRDNTLPETHTKLTSLGAHETHVGTEHGKIDSDFFGLLRPFLARDAFMTVFAHGFLTPTRISEHGTRNTVLLA
jgi:hypothetical protein